MILSDISIKERCVGDKQPCGGPMISPFLDHLVREDEQGEKVVSYGLSSFGYDIRLAPEFKTFTRPNDGRVIDIKDFREEDVCEFVEADSIIVPPGGLVLARTIEYFRVPEDVLVECLGKSTWARVGAIVNVTPLEPGWEGNLVIEITNGTNLPLKIYAKEGIAQLVFHKGDRVCKTSYSDRGGKYNGQTGIKGSCL